MITLYLLKGCKHCSKILKFLKNNTVNKLLLSILTKKEALNMKKLDNRLDEFPILFLCLPNNKGVPSKKSCIKYSGADNIINYFKKSLNKFNGSNIDINLDQNNNGNIKNIRQYRSNCFGKSNFNCHIMDRPFGPMDNQYLLQNYQPECAIPTRNNLPIKSKFGNQIPILKCPQNNNNLNINYPLQFKDNNLNTECAYKNKAKLEDDLKTNLVPKTKFGKYVSALDNSNDPFLTYSAGGTTDSRVTKQPYFFTKQQNPIELQSSGYIKGDIKKYVDNPKNSQNLLKKGLNSKWSLDAQGVDNKFGKDLSNKNSNQNNPLVMVSTTNNEDQGNFAVAQYFRRDMFPHNGNFYGKKNKIEKLKNSKKINKYVSPLGIEISF